MQVKKPVTKSRYVYPDHIKTGHIWTEDGLQYQKVYKLLSKLKIVNFKKVLADFL